MTHEPDRTLPSIRGIAVTDVNAVLGAILWVGLAATPRFDGVAGKLSHQYQRGTGEGCHLTPNT